MISLCIYIHIPNISFPMPHGRRLRYADPDLLPDEVSQGIQCRLRRVRDELFAVQLIMLATSYLSKQRYSGVLEALGAVRKGSSQMG